MHQLGCALAAKLQENIGAVSVQSSDADVESLSYLLPAFPLCYELKHLPLPRRKRWLLHFFAHSVVSLDLLA